jgi:hypothetical protein
MIFWMPIRARSVISASCMPAAKVLLLRIARQVVQRQHRDRSDLLSPSADAAARTRRRRPAPARPPLRPRLGPRRLARGRAKRDAAAGHCAASTSSAARTSPARW